MKSVLDVAAGAALALALAWSGAARSATFTVTSTDDDGPGSLREAIVAANGNPGADVIEFDVKGSIVLLSPLPVVAGSLSLQGPGAEQLVIDAGKAHRHFRFGGVAGNQYLVQDLTLRDGHAGGDAGGSILSLATVALTVRRCIVEASTSDDAGGGIAAFGPLLLEDSIVRGNEGRFGGGISLAGADSEIRRSAIVFNQAENGGGIVVNPGAQVTIENSTVSGNMAYDPGLGAGTGGGIGAVASAAVSLIHVTIADNVAEQGAGIALTGGAVLDGMANSILAYNELWDSPSPSNCFGPMPSDFGNLSSDFTCAFGGASDLDDVDPLLDAPADNGGFAPTRMLLSGSPAIDSALSGHCLAEDQRGLVRPDTPDGACDRGALEVSPGDHPDLIFANGFEEQQWPR